MNAIKNIHVLKGIVPDDALQRLEKGAALHKRLSNITFKILDVSGIDLHVRAEQGKHLSENYADTKTLITRARELFSTVFTHQTIYVHPIPYAKPIVDVVTPKWIQNEMLTLGIKIKDFTALTGIDKSNFSAWFNDLRPMSQIVKAMIFNIVNQFAIKAYVNFLNTDVQEHAFFMIKKHFDKDLLISLLESNKNVTRYHYEFKENETDFIITLEKKY